MKQNIKFRPLKENIVIPVVSDVPVCTDYYPSKKIGTCSKCHVVCTLDFPKGTDVPKTFDKIMDNKPVQMYCPSCKKTTEFVPYDYKKYPDKDVHYTLKLEQKRLLRKALGK